MKIATKKLKAKEEELQDTEFARLLADRQYLTIPKSGDLVKGRIIFIDRHEIRLDIPGYRAGVVRGREIIDESHELEKLRAGDDVEATVLDLENENGDMELSFRSAGHQRAWDRLAELHRAGTQIQVKVLEANKGGLMVSVDRIPGFLPVSQLAPEHYPRISGGDKGKILEKLRSFIGMMIAVKILDLAEGEEKLILSEKSIWEDSQRAVLAKYKIGDVIEGAITALTDFGAFVRFDGLEGLVHISEIAWQRIDHPKDLLSVGETARAEIIGMEGSKIFLSMKRLADDPWKNVGERYHVGQIVRGKVLKVNPFGFFVELDKDIHGLAHISELDVKAVPDPSAIASIGDELEFKIVSIEPEHHRLGLSRKAFLEAPSEGAEAPAAESAPTAPNEQSPAPTAVGEAAAETPAPAAEQSAASEGEQSAPPAEVASQK
ncbi:MAG: S1 RNA-binding domain-containing protein [Patescibacteria group bacterium]